ncbi:methylated-DNA--[protein]-cysteine S-methyltransferase [Parachlamydia acanthamoebae]|jgi:methylated-DNA-[protein]-cysteine S-methyltransferase|uniref:methylated-DNA--[protein]-cysteine S-methyltransferase n=1 Tax=Parachlamydia acanthamoebae TaxID=83552 RepID=UPI0024E23745|nr:methylated-DNA--[protein]-cysteine S-methyltransferase [Parachlamydia acanthamoebae]
MELLKYKIIKTPVGFLKIVVNHRALLAILWDNEKLNRVRLDQMLEDKNDPLILETEKQLNEYFNCQRKAFDLPIEMLGTLFQKEVWKRLNLIPYGSTWTYKDVALKIHHPQAIRAVGAAIGRNPISIIVPCHRVIATNGRLTGFAGGLDRKKFLLDLEMLN